MVSEAEMVPEAGLVGRHLDGTLEIGHGVGFRCGRRQRMPEKRFRHNSEIGARSTDDRPGLPTVVIPLVGRSQIG